MRTILLVLAVAAALYGSALAADAKSCASIRCVCKQAHKAAIQCCLQPCCDDSGNCYPTLVDDKTACIDASNQGIQACIDRKCTPIPGDPGGHCQPTVDCVEACATANSPSKCDAVFQRAVKRLKKQCTTFPACRDQARADFETCLTTGTTIPCSASLTRAVTTTTTSLVGATTTTTVAPPQCDSSLAEHCATLAGQCAQGIVGKCYADCVDKCHHNPQAEKICRQGCRDGHCVGLRETCRKPYNQCCGITPDQPQIPGNDVPHLNCTPTTTSTSSTTSTSVITVSTTTVTSTTTSTTTP